MKLRLLSLLLAIALVAVILLVTSKPAGVDAMKERYKRSIDSISMGYRALKAHDDHVTRRYMNLVASLDSAAVKTVKQRKHYEKDKRAPVIRYADAKLDSVLQSIYPR